MVELVFLYKLDDFLRNHAKQKVIVAFSIFLSNSFDTVPHFSTATGCKLSVH